MGIPGIHFDGGTLCPLFCCSREAKVESLTRDRLSVQTVLDYGNQDESAPYLEGKRPSPFI